VGTGVERVGRVFGRKQKYSSGSTCAPVWSCHVFRGALPNMSHPDWTLRALCAFDSARHTWPPVSLIPFPSTSGHTTLNQHGSATYKTDMFGFIDKTFLLTNTAKMYLCRVSKNISRSRDERERATLCYV
jgi:hypothetical protein